MSKLREDARAAVAKHGSIAAAARALGISRTTLQSRLDAVSDRPGAPQRRPDEDTPAHRAETRDAAFWKRQALRLQAELGETEHILRQVAGITSQKASVPSWMLPSARTGRSVLGILLSDAHAGEVIEPGSIAGINRFDIEECRVRIRKLFTEACHLGQRWGANEEIEGVYLALGGDLISGDIHEELMRTNELTSHGQVLFMVEELRGGIDKLRAYFGHVHVECVPGNHGRTTKRPPFKLMGQLSYDTLIGAMLQEQMRGEPGVTFRIASGADLETSILGTEILLTHGDNIGTKGGQGFAGPALPIVRGTKKIEAQYSRIRRPKRLTLMGHYHASNNPFGVLANGSIPGYSEFGNGIRAAVEPPMQWVFMINDRIGLCERAEVHLAELGVDAPESTIPSFMAA